MDVQDTGGAAAGVGPASFLATASALGMMDAAARTARHAPQDPAGQRDPQQALAALMLLRHLREELAGWETGLIETARGAGATWADLAEPLGVASRQAAERRYLRPRPNATAGVPARLRCRADHARRKRGGLPRRRSDPGCGAVLHRGPHPVRCRCFCARARSAPAESGNCCPTSPSADPHAAATWAVSRPWAVTRRAVPSVSR